MFAPQLESTRKSPGGALFFSNDMSRTSTHIAKCDPTGQSITGFGGERSSPLKIPHTLCMQSKGSEVEVH